MEEILKYFVNDAFSMTPIILAAVLLLLFIILSMYSGLISKVVFPSFGYKKYFKYLPFDSILSDGVTIRLRNGTVVRAFALSGIQTSMKDNAEKEKLLDLRAQLLNQIRDSNAVMRFFTIRDKESDKTDYEFDQPTLQKIYNQWNNQGLKIFRNNYYLVLSVGGSNALEKINQYTNYVESILAAYQVRVLKHNDKDNFANLYARILSPVTKPKIQRTDVSMNDMITVDSVEFLSNGQVRYSSGADKKFAALCSFKTAPDYMDEDFFDEVNTIQAEIITMNSFQVLGNAGIETAVRQSLSGADSNNMDQNVVTRQLGEAVYAMDENISGNQSLVNYYPLFIVFGDSEGELKTSVAEFKKICASNGISPVIENFATKVSWFAALPGFDVFPRVFKLLSRTAAISTPMSSVPAGVPNSDWGPGPLVVFPTAQGTPYQFQFHVSESQGAVAHTLTIGPTGGGKTTLFSFLIAQSLRHPKLKAFFFDRNRGAEIFTLSTGGKYLTFQGRSKDSDVIGVGVHTQLNPFKMEDTTNNRAFMRRWLSMISGHNDPQSLDEIARAVSVNFDYLDIKDRKLANLWTSCFSSDGHMRPALKKWVDPLQFGSVFNENRDTLDLFSRLTTFDFTDILSDETLAPAVLSYLIHRINQITVSGGNPSLIMIDETAPMLQNAMFRENFIVGLQEGRKNRQAYMAAFQRANILDKLGIGDVVRGQAQTIMFFRNPAADAADYQHWRLNPLEMAFIQGKAYPNLKRAVLLSRPVNGESVVLNTELGGLGAYLRLFESGRSSVLLAEELYRQFGTEFVEEYLKKQNV
jgi:type IV secretion system protein VirB4